MKKIYVTFNRKWLDNGHNDSRYSLQYFIDNQVPSFIANNFPEYTQDDYKGIYSLVIQEIWNDTEGFAVVERDDLTHDEIAMLAGMQSVIEFMGITKLANQAAARSWLDANGYTKIDNSTYEISPEFTDVDGEVIPAQFLYL